MFGSAKATRRSPSSFPFCRVGFTICVGGAVVAAPPRGLAVNEWDWINPIFPPNIKIQRVDVRMHKSCTVGERQNCLELT